MDDFFKKYQQWDIHAVTNEWVEYHIGDSTLAGESTPESTEKAAQVEMVDRL